MVLATLSCIAVFAHVFFTAVVQLPGRQWSLMAVKVSGYFAGNFAETMTATAVSDFMLSQVTDGPFVALRALKDFHEKSCANTGA